MATNSPQKELIYLPILRDGRNEREVMREFSSLHTINTKDSHKNLRMGGSEHPYLA